MVPSLSQQDAASDLVGTAFPVLPYISLYSASQAQTGLGLDVALEQLLASPH